MIPIQMFIEFGIILFQIGMILGGILVGAKKRAAYDLIFLLSFIAFGIAHFS